MRGAAVVLVLLLMPGAAMAQDAGAQAGATLFKRCAICHAVGPDAKTKVGPQLNGLAGRKAGSVAGFSYSQANKAARIVWDEATFVDYIRDPAAKIPGTKKVFTGIASADDAHALWQYLASFAADGSRKAP